MATQPVLYLNNYIALFVNITYLQLCSCEPITMTYLCLCDVPMYFGVIFGIIIIYINCECPTLEVHFWIVSCFAESFDGRSFISCFVNCRAEALLRLYWSICNLSWNWNSLSYLGKYICKEIGKQYFGILKLFIFRFFNYFDSHSRISFI